MYGAEKKNVHSETRLAVKAQHPGRLVQVHVADTQTIANVKRLGEHAVGALPNGVHGFEGECRLDFAANRAAISVPRLHCRDQSRRQVVGGNIGPLARPGGDADL
jgi:hypothetical protein